MRILHFCPCYVDLNNETGGVANIVRHICLNLAQFGHDVTLVCGNREMGRVCHNAGYFQDHGVTQIVVSQHRNPLFGPIANLWNLVDSFTPDSIAHVHTCFSRFTESALTALLRRGVPTVFTPHGKLSESMVSTRRWPKRLWWRAFGRASVGSATSIVTSSPFERSQLESFSGLSVTTAIPNGFTGISTAHPKRTITEPYVLYLGYIDPRKQPEFLVKAFARSETSKSHRLIIAGPDTYQHASVVRDEAARLGVADRVTFFGPVYGDDKWTLMRHARCLALPSKGEGMPVVLTESLGAAVPSIASPQCNFQHIADLGVGLTVPLGDVNAWSRAIDRLCLAESEYDRYSKMCHNLADDFRWDQIARQWESHYLATLSRTSSVVSDAESVLN